MLLVCLNECKTKEDAEPNLVVSSIFPTSGPYATQVTIQGSGFSLTASDNLVTFNGKPAVVKEAAATHLRVLVPKAAVSVKYGANTGQGPVFDYMKAYIIRTVAGGISGGYRDGLASDALFSGATGITVDSQGNIYVAESENHRIRKLTPDGMVSTFAGNAGQGYADGQGYIAQFNKPLGLTMDLQGNMYVSDANNCRIRKITPNGIVSTLAGSDRPQGSAGSGDGPGNVAQFYNPIGMNCDAQGNILVADYMNQRIRKVTPSGMVSTVAGNGAIGSANGVVSIAEFNYPMGITTDSQGNIYVCEYGSHLIRKITPTGAVSTFAGSGLGFADGPVTSARFAYPFGLACDAQGNVYVADLSNRRLRKITPTGLVSTVASNEGDGIIDGEGIWAEMGSPQGVTLDQSGNFYIATSTRIQKITFE